MNDAVDYIPCNNPKPKAISHGLPYNRGRADSWYERDINPHYYPNGTYKEPRIDLKDMTKDQIDAYIALKFEEIHKFEHAPHPVEFEMYYSS